MVRTFFNTLFPDDCRLCDARLTGISRIPVCQSCLALPRPLETEYFCTTCRTPFVSSFSLDANGKCPACRDSLLNFDAAYSYGNYEGSLQKLIQLFKYGKVETLAGPLSRLLLQSLPLNDNFDVIQAMPMHWFKQWQRGFNQAELLAAPVAHRFGLKLSHNLVRVRGAKAQASLNEKQRQENLKGSLLVKRPADIAGRRVLLIDDVFTTGASLRAAASVLKNAGAARVTALTLARVDRRTSVPGERRRLKGAGRVWGFDTNSASGTAAKRKSQSAVLGAK